MAKLRGPQGLPALREKWDEIRQLEEENANLQRENDYRRDRIKKLESSPSEQELEIRKKLKLLRPGETSFILPEQPKPAPSGRAARRRTNTRLKIERDDPAVLSPIQAPDCFESPPLYNVWPAGQLPRDRSPKRATR